MPQLKIVVTDDDDSEIASYLLNNGDAGECIDMAEDLREQFRASTGIFLED